ncbi:hypothetical protein CBR_g23505 [Chara braunii]|uniref:Uncharacterized protein n=1 Tax=Chara braunii TaxID=69332 RepID=A0A388L4E0_CHABU|nr:hypothetical protein CBR_g23505 [Chara braunii]|eukprot:GBG77179.1 hypothetical protein CBR_g23505 [Chara braunii]
MAWSGPPVDVRAILIDRLMRRLNISRHSLRHIHWFRQLKNIPQNVPHLNGRSAIATAETLAGEEAQLRDKCETMRHELESLKSRLVRQQSENADLKAQQEHDRTTIAAGEGEASKLREQLQNATKDAEHLKSLVNQLDMTREELASKLRCSVAEQRQTANHVQELQMQRDKAREALEQNAEEIAHLKRVLEAVDRERDMAQSEANLRSEEISRLMETNLQKERESVELTKELQRSEQRVQIAEECLQKADIEVGRV